ncbi:MAG: phage minor head protein [Pseudomonadota bacterium]
MALAAALLSIGRAARRGVRGAMAGASVAALAELSAAPDPTPPDGGAAITQAVEHSVASSVAAQRTLEALLGAAVGAMTAAVLQEHSRQVQTLAVAAGSEGYIWTTQHDSKVRATHAVLDGTRQLWVVRPFTDHPDFHGHPGEPAQCRCVAYPLAPP